MKKHYFSLDFLRGLGIFMVLVLHTAFYFYKDIYDIDLDNPTLIITLIGFLLMFAGLFAMVSGVSHTISYINKLDHGLEKRTRYMVLSGTFLLVIAYLYFVFTGPGIILFESRAMDESLFVSLINQGSFQKVTQTRFLYVDSLVMLGMNVILLGLLFKFIGRYLKNPKITLYLLLGASFFMVISYIRIPLYNVYLNALDNQNMGLILLLNWFVAKNNPILPFFAFALFGAWVGTMIYHQSFKQMKKNVLIVAGIYLVIGILGYIFAPETMLERAIDPTWYFIMVIQIGLFLIMILFAYQVYDNKDQKKNVISIFLSRFGIAGLSVFFIESVVSALLFKFINLFFDFSLGIPGAILYGLFLALLWGFVLYFWQKKQFKYGIEWIHSSIMNRIGLSTKLLKLKGEHDDSSNS
ncbi:MAG: heparan-alpha-glucosaminide N-acetyltransferase domain-containing protein [Acholeplasmataceae bacterium]|nr:heparan-alpha-glucosaminide N-acetyltransferase domain-containing protein [Acholeplasmataceae bacterium]